MHQGKYGDPEQNLQDDPIGSWGATTVNGIAGENRELVPRASRGEGEALVVVVLMRVLVRS
jgi:hypothetical protein